MRSDTRQRLFALLLVLPVAAGALAEPRGLVDAPDVDLVLANCSSCHSEQLVAQHRLSREGWLQTIRWMQQKHNLWDLGSNESRILDYLTTHYGVDGQRRVRRRNLNDS